MCFCLALGLAWLVVLSGELLPISLDMEEVVGTSSCVGQGLQQNYFVVIRARHET